jgi:hypothetical protein
MPMNHEELRDWAEVQAEGCLRFHAKLTPEELNEIKTVIAGHLYDAYRLGVQGAKLSLSADG